MPGRLCAMALLLASACQSPPPPRPGVSLAACEALASQRRRQGGVLTVEQQAHCRHNTRQP